MARKRTPVAPVPRATPTVGAPPPDDARRDAIHIAIAPVIAREPLMPGQRVGLVAGMGVENWGQTVGPSTDPIGVIDPFIPEPIVAGQRVWLFMFPETITSLRHEWTHPAFDIGQQSKEWLQQFANEVGISYERLMEGAAGYLEYKKPGGNKWGGWRDSGITLDYSTPSVVYEKRREFWKHYEKVTGVAVDRATQDETFISCSC